MGYVGFDDCGYKYFDEGHYVLFAEDNSYELLFHYVVQDLSCLPNLFDQYISQRMDIATFKLHDCPGGDVAIDQMKRVLIDAHPYYRHEVREVLIRAIGDYFNELLLYSCYRQDGTIPDFSEARYMERVTALLAPLLKLGDTYPSDFYNEYLERTGGNSYTAEQPDDEIETAIYGVPREMPAGFSREIRTQREIYNMLYFLLDIAAPGLETLTTPQRIWLYGNIVASSGSEMTVPKRLSLKHPTLYQSGHDYSRAVEHSRELDDKFYPLYALGKLNVGRDGIPADMEETFRSAIEYTKAVGITSTYKQYEISSLHQLLYLEIMALVQNRIMIRKCRRCGEYFVVDNRKKAYCDRTDESGVCCSVVGSRQSYQKKMKTDTPLRIYSRAYKTHHARVQKGTMGQNDFRLWCDEAKLRLDKARAGELDVAQFQEWLKK